MTRTCTVCTSESRPEIDASLIAGVTLRTIADRWSVSKTALIRHRTDHLPEALLKAQEVKELTDADKLKDELEAVKDDVARLKDSAEEEGDYRTALMGCDRALKALELQAKLLQIISDAPQINLYLSGEWIELRAAIVRALEPYSDARGAVLKAIEGVGNGRP